MGKGDGEQRKTKRRYLPRIQIFLVGALPRKHRRLRSEQFAPKQDAPIEGNLHCTMHIQKLPSGPQAPQILEEPFDPTRFTSGEYWNEFSAEARRAYTWREQARILIQHLYRHRHRLSQYRQRPNESWLVGWALSNVQTPLRRFLVWSLRAREELEGVTIGTFANHLELWADVFLSEEALYYALANPERQFFLHQVNSGAPWMAHFLDSQSMHRVWAATTWKRYWLRSGKARNVHPNVHPNGGKQALDEDAMDWEPC